MTVLVALATVRRAAERAQRRFVEDMKVSPPDDPLDVNDIIAMAGAAVMGRFVEEISEEMKNPREPR